LRAVNKIYQISSNGKRVLFVSTSTKFGDLVSDTATRTNQHYIRKWLGGTLTNWRTIVSSIKTLRRHNELLSQIEQDAYLRSTITKKEILSLQRRSQRLHNSFGGMTTITGIPDLVVVLSVKNEKLAISEANCIGIPVVGIVDTNADPYGVSYPIPGNDDSLRAMNYYCNLFADAALAGAKFAATKESTASSNDQDSQQHKGRDGRSRGNGVRNTSRSGHDKSPRPNTAHTKTGEQSSTDQPTIEVNV